MLFLRRKLILILLALLIVLSLIISCAPTQVPINLPNAIQKVVDEVLDKPLDYNVIVFGINQAVNPNTTITELFRATPITITEASFFFWIDPRPGARYSHDSKVVIVKKASGALTQYEWNFWPIINGVSLWKNRTDYWDETGWLWNHFEETVKPQGSQIFMLSSGAYEVEALNTGEAAVVARGDEGNDFKKDEENMTGFYNSQSIPVTSATPTSGATGFINAINTAASLPEVQDITVYFTGHGGTTEGGEPYIVMGGQQVTASQLSAAIAAHPTKTFKIIIDACNSGGFVGPLSELGNVICIYTAASADGYSYDDIDKDADPNPEDQGGEWTSGFHEDLQLITSNPASMLEIEDEAFIKEVPVISIVYKYAAKTAREKDAAAINGWSDPQNYPAEGE